MEMIRRVAIAQATLDHWKDRPFAYGKVDCVRMVAWHLRKMGHRPALSKGGAYSSALGARRALKRAGFTSVAAALDALGLERIAPAAALVGDVLELPSEDDVLGGFTVALSNGRVLGFHQGVEGAAVLQPREYKMAWRV